jgi:hypothetical protein
LPMSPAPILNPSFYLTRKPALSTKEINHSAKAN